MLLWWYYLIFRDWGTNHIAPKARFTCVVYTNGIWPALSRQTALHQWEWLASSRTLSFRLGKEDLCVPYVPSVAASTIRNARRLCPSRVAGLCIVFFLGLKAVRYDVPDSSNKAQKQYHTTQDPGDDSRISNESRVQVQQQVRLPRPIREELKAAYSISHHVTAITILWRHFLNPKENRVPNQTIFSLKVNSTLQYVSGWNEDEPCSDAYAEDGLVRNAPRYSSSAWCFVFDK